MKKISAFSITGIVSVLAFASIAPEFASASSLSDTSVKPYVSKIKISEVNNTINSDFTKTEPSELAKIMKEENISESDFIAYGNYVKEETSKEITPRWKGAAVKKAVKFMVDHYDIIPSKTLRNAVKKYGNKIVNAIDTAETYTWYGIAKALTKAKVPDKYADAIADFIVKFLL